MLTWPFGGAARALALRVAVPWPPAGLRRLGGALELLEPPEKARRAPRVEDVEDVDEES